MWKVRLACLRVPCQPIGHHVDEAWDVERGNISDVVDLEAECDFCGNS